MKLLQQVSFSGGTLGSSADLITLRNASGMVAQFTNYGARWVSMWVADREGVPGDVLLGFDTYAGYRDAGEQYHGAIVGRVCGRTNNACFSLSGVTHRLAANDAYGYPGRNHLHGGIQALHNRFWQWSKQVDAEGDEVVVFTCFSPDGEEGYPGNLKIKVAYTLKASGVLRMEMDAETDRPTPVNLTNHAFFNLQSNLLPKNILSHRLTLHSSDIIACDSELIPTGNLLAVSGSPLDFSTSRTIASSLAQPHSQTQDGRGFSIAYALPPAVGRLTLAACLADETSGRQMTIYTNQLSVQVYTAFFMDGSDRGKNDTPYFASAGIALETQGYPDALNQPSFPSVVLEQDKTYKHITEYHFTSHKEATSE